MAKNQIFQKQADGSMLLLFEEIVPDIFAPLTLENIKESLNGLDISALSLTGIISTKPEVTPHSASDVDILTSYRTQALLSLSTDNNEERINKTIKHLMLLGFSHEVRLRVLEGKLISKGDKAKADTIALDFITFVAKFRAINQEGIDYKTANSL